MIAVPPLGPMRIPALPVSRALALLALHISGAPPDRRSYRLRWKTQPWPGSRDVVRKGWRLLALVST